MIGDDAGCGIARQQADDEGRKTHDGDGDEEGVLAADEIADPAEHQGAERTHCKARGKSQQGEDEAGGRVDAGEELLGHDDGECAVEIEVVPLEDGAERRGEDDGA
jgi:hypothetical protein